MKVKNPSTGNFEEVYVKALDSLPVGSEIDFTGSVSDIPVGWEQVDSYSTSEVNTGKTWIDGKPIYKKVFTGTIGSSGSSVTVGNIPNINVITFSGIVNTTNSRQHPISTYWSDTIKNVPEYFKSNGNIVLNYSAQYYGQDYELIVEYTKTTD